MKVLVYISKGVSDADRQYLTDLFSLINTNLTIVVTNDIPILRHDFSLFHLIGCWDAKTLLLYNLSLRTHTPVVLSPFGELNPWRIRSLSLPKRMVMTMPVKRMLGGVGVLHACGQLESETLKRRTNNANIVRIDNPRISKAVEFSDAANQFLRMYNKTLNTWPSSMLTQADLELTGLLVLAGVDPEMFGIMDLRSDAIEALSTPHWRFILMYAAQERVLDMVRKGLETLKAETPSTDLSGFETFSFDPIPEDSSLENDEQQEEADEQTTDDDAPNNDPTIGVIVDNVRALYESLPKDTAHLQLLTNLYASLRLNDYDEQMLVKALNAERLLPFFRRAEGVMHRLLKLPEGFMPTPPLEDNRTAWLTTKITKVYKQ